MYKYKTIRLPGPERQTRSRHRLIMEKHLGRKLTFNEVVDHINGNRQDDRIENLRVMTRSEHSKMHMKEFYKNPEFARDRRLAVRKSMENFRVKHTQTKFACNVCKKLKSRDQFWPLKSRWNGLRHSCIECEKKRIR